MKRLLTITTFLLGVTLSLFAGPGATTALPLPSFVEASTLEQDTIIINVGDSKVVIYVDNQEELKRLEEHSIDSIVSTINKELSKISLEQRSGKDTTIVIQPLLTVNKTNSPDVINVKLSYDEEGTAQNESFNIRIPRMANFKVEYKDGDTPDEDDVKVKVEPDTCSREKKDNLELTFNFGFNNWIERKTGQFPSGVPYELNPSQSRYFNLGWMLDFGVGSSPVSIITGLELNYNNYMFDKRVRVADENGATVFYNDTINNVRKSKLRTTFVNLPVMVGVTLERPKGKRGVTIAAGGDVGYRLGSKAITKFNPGGKEKNAGNFNLNNYQYGVRAQLGYGPVLLFARYSLSPMFVSGAGPDVNPVSLGIVF